MNFLKSIKPELAFATLFAILAVISLVVGQYGKNGYFTIAAAAFALATYVTYPPAWVVQVAKMVVGKTDEKE